MFEGWFGVSKRFNRRLAQHFVFYKSNKREPENEKKVPYKPSSEDLVEKGDFCTK
jgi:hypothetical protein